MLATCGHKYMYHQLKSHLTRPRSSNLSVYLPHNTRHHPEEMVSRRSGFKERTLIQIDSDESNICTKRYSLPQPYMAHMLAVVNKPKLKNRTSELSGNALHGTLRPTSYQRSRARRQLPDAMFKMCSNFPDQKRLAKREPTKILEFSPSNRNRDVYDT